MDQNDSSLLKLDGSQKAESQAILEAIEYGIDITLLESCLDCSYQERLERHESALMLATELKKAGEQLYKA